MTRDRRLLERLRPARAASRRHGPPPRRRRLMPSLESLESRAVPATIIVTSGADDPMMALNSLRSAIQSINDGASVNGSIGASGIYGVNDAIRFAIGAAGSRQTIGLTTQLPDLARTVLLDGWSQGGAGYQGAPLIALHDAGALDRAGLVITSADSTVQGLAIGGYGGYERYGLVIDGAGATGNTLQGNYIGVSLDGVTASANANGILIRGGASGNTVGGTTPAARNVISGNLISGVRIEGAGTTGNLVAGNYIGTDAAGAAPLGNRVGVSINRLASGNTVGGTAPGSRNLISGNDGGVLIGDSGTSGNLVAGNFIGTDAAGSAPLGNTQGVVIGGNASGNTVGGAAPGSRNLISGNDVGVWIAGVWIAGVGTTGNLVAGNYIGTDATGAAPLGNGTGVYFRNGSSGNTLGGTDPAARNVISANAVGVRIDGLAHSNLVAGNLIGTDAAGAAALGNGAGVLLVDREIVSPTRIYVGGVVTLDSYDDDDDILDYGATSNTVGGTAPGAGNVIAFNNKGVVVGGGPAQAGTIGNSIVGNSIFGNIVIGIDLGNDGPTPNGANPRLFPNNGQNHPLLLTASGTAITGVLDSAAAGTYRIEFFAGPAGSTGQGQVFLGSLVVATDASGRAAFRFPSPGIPAGMTVTATATVQAPGGLGDSSEFSPALTPSIDLLPDTLPALTANRPFTAALTASGGSGGPYTFAVTLGALPTGLSLNPATGALGGTPTIAGETFGFTITATDSNGGRNSQPFSGVVNARIVVSPATLPAVTVGRRFRLTARGSGGSGGPYSFAVTAGALPDGLALDPSTGRLSGTPTAAGAYAFTVTATAAGGDTGSQSYRGIIRLAQPAQALVVRKLQRFGFHAQRTIFVVSFNAALDPARAQELGNYRLFSIGAGARGLRPVRLAAAVYDPAQFTVTLHPAARSLDLRRSYLLKINGATPSGLIARSGTRLDGLGDGHPGSAYSRAFGPEILAGPNRPARRRAPTDRAGLAGGNLIIQGDGAGRRRAPATHAANARERHLGRGKAGSIRAEPGWGSSTFPFARPRSASKVGPALLALDRGNPPYRP